MADDEITRGDFPEGYRDVVDLLGVDNALTLAQRYAGTKIYVPKIDDIERKKRNIKIRKAFLGGVSILELCQRFGLTETQIRNILFVKQGTIEDFIEKEEKNNEL